MIQAASTGQSERNLVADAAMLRALHVPGRPLLLANVWDPMTARAVAASGLPAIATASAAVAPVNGYEDHGHLPPDVAFDVVRRIASFVSCPVTADMEDGYGLAPRSIAERLLSAGACGLNLEDSDHRGEGLVHPDVQAERIAGIRNAGRELGVDIVINARIDVHLLQRPLAEGLERARIYFEAGADCVYPIFAGDAEVVREYVALGPTNLLCRPGGLKLREMAELGAARISLGPMLFHLMLRNLERSAQALGRFDDEGLWGDAIQN